MARSRRRSSSLRREQKVSWYPFWLSAEITLPNDTTTVQHGNLGFFDLTPFVEHEATLERTRGRIVLVKQTTGLGQFSVAGQVIPKKLAEATTISPDLTNHEDGDDFFFWQSFACVDSDATSQWNGAEIDSKARRRLEPGDCLSFSWTGRTLNTQGINEKYDLGLNVRILLKFN